MKLPKVTCICLTRNRLEYLERAINCFRTQTYENKELLIVYHDNDLQTKNYISKITFTKIKSLEIPDQLGLTLGARRNFAIANCDSDFICNWDDDDWYHQDRLNVQVKTILLQHKPVSLLAHVFLYDDDSKRSYMSNRGVWENTLMCYRSIFDKFEYGNLNKSGDRYLIDKLVNNNLVYPVFMPQLYIYVYHGHNIWNKDHFNLFFSNSQKLSDESDILITNILRNNILGQEASIALNDPKILSQLCYVKYK